MFIKSIDWMDEERREAIVIVSDMENEIKCFADGLKYDVGDVLVDPLECLTTKNVFRSYENKTFIDTICLYANFDLSFVLRTSLHYTSHSQLTLYS